MLTVMQSYKASTTVAALLSFHALFTEVYTSTFLLEGRLLAGTCFFFPTPCICMSVFQALFRVIHFSTLLRPVM